MLHFKFIISLGFTWFIYIYKLKPFHQRGVRFGEYWAIAHREWWTFVMLTDPTEKEGKMQKSITHENIKYHTDKTYCKHFT